MDFKHPSKRTCDLLRFSDSDAEKALQCISILSIQYYHEKSQKQKAVGVEAIERSTSPQTIAYTDKWISSASDPLLLRLRFRRLLLLDRESTFDCLSGIDLILTPLWSQVCRECSFPKFQNPCNQKVSEDLYHANWLDWFKKFRGCSPSIDLAILKRYNATNTPSYHFFQCYQKIKICE